MRNNTRMLHKVNDIPLSYKFILIYLLCILLPIITINMFFYQRNSSDIKVREEENLRRSIERAASELLSMIDESVALSHSIANDASIYASLDRTYSTPVDYYEAYYEYLRDKLNRFMSTYPNLLEIRIYTDNDTIQTGASYYVIDPALHELNWLEQFKQSNEHIRLMAYAESSGFMPGNRISIVSRMVAFPSYSSYEKYLRIDLNVEKMQRIMSRERDNLRLWLVDDRGRLVVDDTGTLMTAGHLSDLAAANSAGLTELAIGDFNYINGWRLVGNANTERIDRLLQDARRSVLWLAAVSMVIPTLLIYIILRSYHYRVKMLSKHMQKIQYERFDRINIQEGRDEIGGLIHTFNVMTGKIKSLINEVYKLEIRQKSLELERVRTELASLQSQMNPHFLFNTLNALLIVCMKNGYLGVTDIIKNLSMLMRQMLGRADDLVPLKEELDFISMYLQIEKFRFGDLFDYEFDIEPKALPLAVPRMSIQPLVENACKHGLQARKDSRKIRIEARLDERSLDIRVIDNGVGMEREKLRKLMEDIRTDRGMDGHVGLRNVYRRLELFYNESARLMISSESGEGTEVRLQIPLSRLGAEGWRKEA